MIKVNDCFVIQRDITNNNAVLEWCNSAFSARMRAIDHANWAEIMFAHAFMPKSSEYGKRSGLTNHW